MIYIQKEKKNKQTIVGTFQHNISLSLEQNFFHNKNKLINTNFSRLNQHNTLYDSIFIIIIF